MRAEKMRDAFSAPHLFALLQRAWPETLRVIGDGSAHRLMEAGTKPVCSTSIDWNSGPWPGACGHWSVCSPSFDVSALE